MAKTAQFDLSGFRKNDDGSYSKISNPQPRIKSTAINICKSLKIDDSCIGYVVPDFGDIKYKHEIASTPKDCNYQTITLTLFGIPMPKQSVRAYIKDDTTLGHYQPQKTVDRKKDYIRQIKEQLPEGFTPFMNEVFVTKFHCIYPPLKSFHKEKGKMERLRNGEIFLKNTQPDLIDNLKKLIFDCLGKDKHTKVPLVLGNDGIIVGEDNTRKYYGNGGCIIIELKGR